MRPKTYPLQILDCRFVGLSAPKTKSFIISLLTLFKMKKQQRITYDTLAKNAPEVTKTMPKTSFGPHKTRWNI